MSATETAAALEALLESAAPVRFAAPLDFVTAHADCRSIAEPGQLLDHLRHRHDDQVLTEAGLLLPGSGNEPPRLHPALTHPGMVIGLRAAESNQIEDLLTPCGLLRGAEPPALRVAASGSPPRTEPGALFVCADILEVALLRALGLRATLCVGLEVHSFETLAALDREFSSVLFDAAEQESFEGDLDAGVGTEAATSAPSVSPALPMVLVGWSVAALSGRMPVSIRELVRGLAQARQFLGMSFSGIWLWKPGQGTLDNLRYRLGLRNSTLVAELFEQSSLSELVEFGRGAALLEEEDSQPVDLFAASAQLSECFRRDRAMGAFSEATRSAIRHYERLLQSDLIGPLEEWAANVPQAERRIAALDLIEGIRLLRLLSPRIHERLSRQLEQGPAGDPNLDKDVDRFMKLLQQTSALARVLASTRPAA